MSLEREILKLRLQIEKETNRDIRKILLEQKKQLENMRSIVGNIFMKYANDEGAIEISSIDRFNEMRKVEKEIVNIRNKLAETTIAITGATLIKSYVDSYYKTASIIDKGVSININYKLLRPEYVQAVVDAQFINQTYSDRIWKNHSKLANKLYDVIYDGIKDGTSIQKMSKEIKDIFGTSSFESQRLIRTEMARCVTEATNQIYEDSGVVDKVMWISTLDEKTNPEDGALDGTIWDLDDSTRPKPPLHPNCRCAISAYLPEWSPSTRRDNITKETIKYQSFTDWKKNN